MSINANVEAAINTQINNELKAYYSYLGMSAYLETTPYDGFAEWMKKQSNEEQTHAMRLYEYLVDRGGKVVLEPIEAPQETWDSPLAIFQSSLENECEVTRQIHEIYETALAEKDYTTMNFLGWFLDEQIEEEKSTSDMVDKLTLAGNDINALLTLNNEAKNRPEEEGEDA